MVYGFMLWGWRKHTSRHVSRPLPWKRSLNSHGSLCWAVPCPAGLGQAASALVLMLCSSLQGSGRVQGCSSVTGSVHRHHMRASAHTTPRTRTNTNTHARSPHFNPRWLVCVEQGHITVTERFDASQKHRIGSSYFLGRGCADCLVFWGFFVSTDVGTCFCLSECM